MAEGLSLPTACAVPEEGWGVPTAVGGRWQVVGGKTPVGRRWQAAASTYHLRHTTYHIPHTAFLALSLWFGVNINSKNLGEGFSNPKFKFFCDVMHPSYG